MSQRVSHRTGQRQHRSGSRGSSGAACPPPSVSLPPALMTVEELAALLRTTKGAIYSRHARGGIPGSLRLGRTIRFDPRIIAQWLAANTTGSPGDER